MKSFTTLSNLYQSLTNDTQTANVTLGTQTMNDGYRKVLGMYDWSFLMQTFDIDTEDGTQFYTVPAYLSKPSSVFVTVGDQRYTPEEITSREQWDRLNRVDNITSDYPQFWFYFNQQIGIYPTPATDGNTITVACKVMVKDLGIADYTTGTIVTTTTGSITVVGSSLPSTAWTVPMAGRYLQIADSNTANKGDGFWYQIASVNSATTISLVREYGGVSITAGSAAYTIGQMPILPENYHQLPVWYAVSEYWDQNGDTDRGTTYRNKYNELLAEMVKEFASPTSGVVLDYGRRRHIQNPNLFITM